MDLSGKTIVVTGVSRGIGKAIVLGLLEKAAKVAGWGLSEPKYSHDNFKFYPVDVTKLGAVKNGFRQVQKDFGEPLHALINNAGLGYFGLMEELSVEQWNTMFDVNVHGVFHCCKTIIPQLKKQRYGHIINISSIAGLVGMQEGSGYCGTKFAVKAITESLFKELRTFNIKVSCVYPGSVNTEFFRNYPGINANDTMMNVEDVAKTVIQVLEMPDNFITMNVEIRPLNPQYK